MKTLKNINSNQSIACVGLFILISLCSAQYKPIDTLGNTVGNDTTLKEMQSPDASIHNRQANDSIKLKHDTIDVSDCFKDGFLFKINSLSHI